MKALILAAGMGTRLAPITDNYPKCMTEVVNGVTIIEQQIASLLENDIKDISVVVGYKSDILIPYLQRIYKDIKIIENKDYQNTNNMYSAYLGYENLKDSDFIMMNADVFFDSSVLKNLIEDENYDAIVTDIGTWNEESMKVVEKKGKLVQISKQIDEKDALGCSIDVYKFSALIGKKFFDKCSYYIYDKNERNLWSEVALNDILKVCEFKANKLNGRWYEIDTHEDLAKARMLFK